MRFYLETLFALVLSIVCALPAHASRLALVIGNDAYSDIATLKNARNDAKLVAGVLRQAGFDVSEANNLSRNALWATLDRFKGRIQKGDEVVFYFAGHGVQVGANQLLLPIDIRAENDSQMQRDSVPLIDVQDALKDARLAMLLIDACRDNPFPKTGTRAVGGTRGLTPPEASTGQIIMMSAGRNQKALDYVPNGGQANGLFAWELSQVLQTPGLEIRSALEEVKNRVDDKARRAGHEQRPSLVNDLRGPFVLLASLKPEPVNPTARPGQASGLSLDDLEKEETTRKEWAAWQKRMQADYDKTAGFGGSADLRAKAWERFLGNYGQDNPLSRDDETLRAQARQRMEAAQGEARQQTAVQPPASQPTLVATGMAAGQVFKDCADCPEMVVIPAGNFQMGSNDGGSDEKPVHSVNVKGFAIGKYEVTRGQFAAFVSASGYNAGNSCYVVAEGKFTDTPNRNWRNPGFGQVDNDPVACVNWEDALAYVKWVSQKSGKQYRLPSEAEWEYACRAGATQTCCGSDNVDSVAVHGGKSGDKTQPVGGKQANAWGLFDMSGNVWEWTQDCWNESYSGAPSDGSAWTTGNCGRRVLRGGSWSDIASNARAAFRVSFNSALRNYFLGFRLARIAP